MLRARQRIIFALFFVTGFCSLLYEIVWLRQALVAFGATTPVISVMTSFVMLGTALGSWFGGLWVRPLCARLRVPPLHLYAAGELACAAGAFAVPALFSLGQAALFAVPSLDSFVYLAGSTFLIGASVIPWTFFMGAAFPIMIECIVESGQVRKGSGFGMLYLANVLGGMCAAFLTAYVLIELNGLRGTLFVAARLNIVAALLAIMLGRMQAAGASEGAADAAAARASAAVETPRHPALALFATGFCGLGTQAVWARFFTPIVGTTIYGFAYLLILYLFGTWLGTWLFLKHSAGDKVASPRAALGVLAGFGISQAVFADPRLGLGAVGMALAVTPFCAASGYLTPLLIEGIVEDRARRLGKEAGAGRAYAFNVVGCVIGPLVAAYLLLPYVSERAAMIALSAPFIVFLAYWGSRKLAAAAAVTAVVLVVASPSTVGEVVARDATATVVASGEGMQKSLSVNSVKVAGLSSIDKVMAHLPMALHAASAGPVRSVLVIGLGAGTTLASVLSWGPDVDVTVVELVPSVLTTLGFFHPSLVEQLGTRPRITVVLDDARRYLARVDKSFDVIIVDPSPPVESASSALLYSVEFYELAKKRLAPGGVLHQWYPQSETRILQAIVKSIVVSFPYVVACSALEVKGLHFIAAPGPLVVEKPDRLAARLPAAAQADLVEWRPANLASAADVFEYLFRRPLRPTALVGESDYIIITDDHPYNEYFKVRRTAPAGL